jgi:hypothetical protein
LTRGRASRHATSSGEDRKPTAYAETHLRPAQPAIF